MVVERNIKRFLNGTDENTRNRHFRYIDFPDEPNHDDEVELLDELLDVEIDAYVDALLDCDNEAEASRLRNSFNFIIEIAEELEIDASQVLGRISNRILEHHESEPEPENEPMPEPENEPIPEPEYDEPIPENYYDLMEKLEQGIDFLVGDLLYEFRLSDDELRSMLTHILNNPNPANHSDELREVLEGGNVFEIVVEWIAIYQLDINEVVNCAMYNYDLRRRYPWVRLYN